MSDQMPCGACAAGIYAVEAIMSGIKMFWKCRTKADALRIAPRCKSDAGHICFGAKDFIASMDFPIKAGQIR